MELIFTSTKALTPKAVEKACADLKLQLTMKGSLKSLPENLHWHYKLAKQPGALEITFMLNENKLMLNCKKNRTGIWISDAITGLQQALTLVEIKSGKG